MTTITKTILLASSAAILALTGMISAVDAAKSGDRSGGAKQHQSSAGKLSAGNRSGKRISGSRTGKHAYGSRIGKHSSGIRHGNYNRRRGNNHIGGRALRGVFIAGMSSGCSYSYRKWRATGSSYWRARYYDCRNG